MRSPVLNSYVYSNFKPYGHPSANPLHFSILHHLCIINSIPVRIIYLNTQIPVCHLFFMNLLPSCKYTLSQDYQISPMNSPSYKKSYFHATKFALQFHRSNCWDGYFMLSYCYDTEQQTDLGLEAAVLNSYYYFNPAEV